MWEHKCPSQFLLTISRAFPGSPRVICPKNVWVSRCGRGQWKCEFGKTTRFERFRWPGQMPVLMCCSQTCDFWCSGQFNVIINTSDPHNLLLRSSLFQRPNPANVQTQFFWHFADFMSERKTLSNTVECACGSSLQAEFSEHEAFLGHTWATSEQVFNICFWRLKQDWLECRNDFLPYVLKGHYNLGLLWSNYLCKDEPIHKQLHVFTFISHCRFIMQLHQHLVMTIICGGKKENRWQYFY